MQNLLRLSGVLGRFTKKVGYVAAWSSLILIIVIMSDVIGRHFFSSGSSRLQELEWHLHTVLFMGCLGFGYVTDTHVRIDLLRERFGVRLKCWVEILGCLFLLFPFCLVLIYYGIDFTYRSWMASEISSSATGLPYRWLIKSTIPLGAAVLLIAGASVFLRNIVRLFRPDLCPEDVAE